ncbi:MAG: SoxR reducing system RseC family protein [Clostridiales bacterium]|nr:SoxR reducing system RseC family protein [Clostridiales bacterium]
MVEIGKVKRIKHGVAYVEIARNEKCGSCKLCAFGTRDSIVMPTIAGEKTSVGQTVAVEMPVKPVGSTALLIYALPLLFLIVGALIGLVGEWWLQITLAAVGLIIGFAAVIPIERYYRRKSGALPKIIEATNENNDSELSTDVLTVTENNNGTRID